MYTNVKAIQGIIASIALLILMGACHGSSATTGGDDVVDPDKSRITISLQFETEMPEMGDTVTVSKGTVWGSRQSNLLSIRHSVYAVHADADAETTQGLFVFPLADVSDLTFTLEVDSGTYNFLVWSDQGPDGVILDTYYDTTNPMSVTILTSPYQGGDEGRDAFCGQLSQRYLGKG